MTRGDGYLEPVARPMPRGRLRIGPRAYAGRGHERLVGPSQGLQEYYIGGDGGVGRVVAQV